MKEEEKGQIKFEKVYNKPSGGEGESPVALLAAMEWVAPAVAAAAMAVWALNPADVGVIPTANVAVAGECIMDALRREVADGRTEVILRWAAPPLSSGS